MVETAALFTCTIQSAKKPEPLTLRAVAVPIATLEGLTLAMVGVGTATVMMSSCDAEASGFITQSPAFRKLSAPGTTAVSCVADTTEVERGV